MSLRRWSGVGTLMLALVVFVGTVRASALAQATGDDDLCSAMAFLGARAPTPVDPADLADGSHACCDLGLCLDASALPPGAAPMPATAPALARLGRATRPNVARPTRRRSANRPRGPPAP